MAHNYRITVKGQNKSTIDDIRKTLESIDGPFNSDKEFNVIMKMIGIASYWLVADGSVSLREAIDKNYINVDEDDLDWFEEADKLLDIHIWKSYINIWKS